MKKIFLLFFLILLLSESSIAKLIIYPNYKIENYSAEVHGGVRATWDISQDKNGILYFANTYGLLIYDGSEWELVRVEGVPGVPIRSVKVTDKQNVLMSYSGSFGEIVKNEKRENSYKEISNIRRSTPYGITELSKNDEYLITTFRYINLFRDNKIERLKLGKNKYERVNKVGDDVYISIRHKGLFILKNKKISLVKGTEYFKSIDQSIIKVFKEKEVVFLVTRGDGIFKSHNNKIKKIDINSDFFNRSPVYCGEKLKNGNYAVGTINGLFIFDQYFNIISHFGIDNGLQDSFIRSIHEDMQGNIWLGLNDGISKINFSSKVKQLEKIKSKIDSITNHIQEFNNNLYLATSKGINKSFVDHKNFRQYFLPIERDKIKGQTWSLLKFDDKNLIVASRWGLGHINKNDVYKRFSEYKYTGSVWNMTKSKIFKDHFFIGGSKGLRLVSFLQPNKVIRFSKVDKGILWSEIYEDENNNEVWIRKTNKGIYKIKFNNVLIDKLDYEVTKYTTNDGIPSHSYRDQNLFRYSEDTILSTYSGIYKLNKENNKFEIDKRFSHIPNYMKKKLESIIQMPNKDYLAVFSEIKKNKRYVSIYIFHKDLSFKRVFVDNDALKKFSRIKLFLHDNLVLMSGSAGVLAIPMQYFSVKNNGKILLEKISVNKEITLNGSNLLIDKVFKYDQNQIDFEIIMTDYINEKINKIRYKLENFDKNFSEYTTNKELTYTNLPPNKYNFIVEGINSRGEKMIPYEYSFEIKPPWWETNYFYIAQLIFFLILILITLLSKKNSKTKKIATSMTFVVIIILFEFLNRLIDPLLFELTRGVPVFQLISTIIVGLLLQPVEKLVTKLLDFFSDFV